MPQDFEYNTIDYCKGRRTMFKTAASQKGLVALVLVLAGFAASFAFSQRQHRREQMRAAALPVTIKQAQPIIRAIERYRAANGTLPKSLFILVPKYIQQIPAPGPAAKAGWHYKVNAGWQSGGWSLSIKVRDEYSPNAIGFGDTFVYHPSGKYPNVAYGGGLMPFGQWGYYVE
jgi:hypothetical protein